MNGQNVAAQCAPPEFLALFPTANRFWPIQTLKSRVEPPRSRMSRMRPARKTGATLEALVRVA
jgi:hypothetical protein